MPSPVVVFVRRRQRRKIGHFTANSSREERCTRPPWAVHYPCDILLLFFFCVRLTTYQKNDFYKERNVLWRETRGGCSVFAALIANAVIMEYCARVFSSIFP